MCIIYHYFISKWNSWLVTTKILDKGHFLCHLVKCQVLIKLSLGFLFQNLLQNIPLQTILEKKHLVLFLRLYGNHQEVTIAHETTHHKCPCVVPNNDLVLVSYQNHKDLGTWKFGSMWHGPGMVCRMMLKMAHDFINDDRNHFLNPSNGIYST